MEKEKGKKGKEYNLWSQSLQNVPITLFGQSKYIPQNVPLHN